MKWIIFCLGLFLICSCTHVKQKDNDSVLKAECFYGHSSSRSSRPTALNGDMFAIVFNTSSSVYCKVIFSHKGEFYKTSVVCQNEKVTDSIIFQSYMIIGQQVVPFHLELKNGHIFGIMGEDLDKGVITLKEFDTE